MAFLEDLFAGIGSSWTSTLLVGAGAVLAAPVVVPVVTAGLRPLVKGVIKTGFLVYEAGAIAVATAGETVSDMLAEVRDEMGTAAETVTNAAAQATEPPQSPLVDEYGRTIETAGAA